MRFQNVGDSFMKNLWVEFVPSSYVFKISNHTHGFHDLLSGHVGDDVFRMTPLCVQVIDNLVLDHIQTSMFCV